MKLSDIKRVRQAVEQGRWVTIEDTAGMEGVKLQVRGLGNADYNRMFAELASALPPDQLGENGVPVEAARERIVVECLKRTCLIGWGLEDEFTPEAVDAAFADPDYGKTFENVVRYAAWRVAGDARAEQDTSAKN